MAKVHISVPLDLDNVEVLKVEVDRETIDVQVESTLKSARCARCGREITVLHGYGEWVKIQHLPSFGRTVFIHYRPQRYEWPYSDTHPTTRQQVSWHEPNSPPATQSSGGAPPMGRNPITGACLSNGC